MAQAETVERLVQAARTFSIDLPIEAAEQLCRYLAQLLVVNRQINLTAIRDEAEAVERHLVDSLAFGLHVRDVGLPPAAVLDLGSGGGFPGVPIACAYPASTVRLLDGTRKKIDAVSSLLAAAGIRNAQPQWARAEDLARVSPALLRGFDTVTARAVGPLPEIIEAGAPFLRAGGALVAWKSAGIVEDERALAARAAARAALEPLPDCDYETDRKLKLIRFRAKR